MFNLFKKKNQNPFEISLEGFQAKLRYYGIYVDDEFSKKLHASLKEKYEHKHFFHSQYFSKQLGDYFDSKGDFFSIRDYKIIIEENDFRILGIKPKFANSHQFSNEDINAYNQAITDYIYNRKNQENPPPKLANFVAEKMLKHFAELKPKEIICKIDKFNNLELYVVIEKGKCKNPPPSRKFILSQASPSKPQENKRS